MRTFQDDTTLLMRTFRRLITTFQANFPFLISELYSSKNELIPKKSKESLGKKTLLKNLKKTELLSSPV